VPPATAAYSYSRWTQGRAFSFHEAGLAYRKEARSNWIAIDQTVLANEQVDKRGPLWAPGAQRWRNGSCANVLRDPDYARALLDDL